MQGLALGVEGLGLVRWVYRLQDKGKLGKFHVRVYSGNVHASDCGSAIVVGAWSMAFLLRQRVEFYLHICM